METCPYSPSQVPIDCTSTNCWLCVDTLHMVHDCCFTLRKRGCSSDLPTCKGVTLQATCFNNLGRDAFSSSYWLASAAGGPSQAALVQGGSLRSVEAARAAVKAAEADLARFRRTAEVRQWDCASKQCVCICSRHVFVSSAHMLSVPVLARSAQVLGPQVFADSAHALHA